MRKELHDLELIDLYLDHKMSESEKKDFEKLLSESESLRQALEDQISLRKGIQRIALKGEIKSAKNGGKGNNLFNTIGFILVFLIVSILFLFTPEDEEKSIYSSTVTSIDEVEENQETPQDQETEPKQSIGNTDKQIAQKERENEIEQFLSQYDEMESVNLDSIDYGDTIDWIVYESFDAEEQVFSFKNSEGGKIEGKQGTILFFPKNAFDIEGNIKIRLKEYYSPADIVLSGLSTTSAGKWIETRGMIDVKAFSNGQELKLKKEVYFPIAFPKEGYPSLSAVKTFYGNKTEQGLDWEVDSTYFFLPCPGVSEYDAYGGMVWNKKLKYIQTYMSDFCFTRKQVAMISGKLVYPDATIDFKVKKGELLEYIISTDYDYFKPILEGYISKMDKGLLLEENKTYNLKLEVTPPGGLQAKKQSLSMLCLDDKETLRNAQNLLMSHYILSSYRLNIINCDAYVGGTSTVKEQTFKSTKDCSISVIPFEKNTYLVAEGSKDEDFSVNVLDGKLYHAIAYQRIGVDQYAVSVKRFRPKEEAIVFNDFSVMTKKALSKKINKLKRYKE